MLIYSTQSACCMNRRNRAILNQAGNAKQTKPLIYVWFGSVCLMLFEQKAVPHQTRTASHYNFMSLNLFCTLLGQPNIAILLVEIVGH